MKNLTLLFVSIISIHVFASDVLVLNNSMQFEGRVVKIKECSLHFIASNSERYSIPAEDICYVQFEDVNNPVYLDYLTMSENNPDACLAGRMDAENHHGKAGLHVFLGVLFGPFAVLGAAVGQPKPQNGKNTLSMSKNQDSFNDPNYLSCYTKKARGQNVTNTLIGWGAWILLIIALGA